MTTAPILAHLTAAVLASATASPGATAAVLAQIQQSEGHYHEGELGEKYLYVESRLKCDCGCGLDVHSCQYQMQCGTSPAWSARIRRDLEAGIKGPNQQLGSHEGGTSRTNRQPSQDVPFVHLHEVEVPETHVEEEPQ